MRPRLALSIGAVLYILLGVPYVLAPDQMLSAFGLATPSEALVTARDSGVLLIGVGIIDWLARDAVGAPLRGLLWGNIFIWAAAMVVNGWEIATGILPTTSLGGLILYAVLVIVFALALRRARGDIHPAE
jgi:hypothetical protein